LRQREIRIAGANQTLRKRLAKRMADVLDEGGDERAVAEAIRKEFNFAGTRANTIARTEIGAVVEQGRALGREQSGVPLKSWLWSRKEDGRSTHAATERQSMANPIQAGEDFTIAGTSVTAPHPRATGLPSHDVNCGCTAISRFPGDKARDVVSRLLRTGFLTYDQLTTRDQRRTDRTKAAGKAEGVSDG